MAYNKRTWLGRQGTGLNKFSIGGASPVTIVNQPDSVTQVGDALSAGNLNDLEDRIEDAFDDVDTALDTKADEQDVTNLNNAISQLDHRLDNLEQAKGDYVVSNYKDGAITPSGKGNWAIVEGLRGVSRVANNLMPDAKQSGSRSFSASTPDYNQIMVESFSEDEVKVIAGHTYLVSAKITRTISQNNAIALVGFCSNGSNLRLPLDNGSANGVVSVLYSPSASGYLTSLALNNYYGKQGFDSGDSIAYADYILTDLSVYFGGTIPSDADTIAEIQQNYPHLLLPSEYGQRIVDSSYSGVRAWARNIFDEQTESGKYDASGSKEIDHNRIRCVNPLPVTANTTYYIKIGNYAGNYCAVFEYDADGNFIQMITPNASTHLFTTSGNCRYITFFLSDLYGTTYKNDVCINVSDSLNGTYTPYHAPQTLSLTFQGKSAGSVSEMYYPESGEQTKPLKTILLKNLSYQESVNGTNGYEVFSEVTDAKGSTMNLISNKLLPASAWEDIARYSVRVGYTQRICVTVPKTVASSVAGVVQWLTDNDVTLTYELATPDPSTFVTPIIDNTLLTEAYGRMSTVQTGTVVDGSFDMGFINL